MQLEAVKAPAADDEKVTVPVGVIAVPGLVSDTVAVQVLPTFTGTDPGTQTTDVVVVR
jgi:hypothetical protein